MYLLHVLFVLTIQIIHADDRRDAGSKSTLSVMQFNADWVIHPNEKNDPEWENVKWREYRTAVSDSRIISGTEEDTIIRLHGLSQKIFDAHPDIVVLEEVAGIRSLDAVNAKIIELGVDAYKPYLIESDLGKFQNIGILTKFDPVDSRRFIDYDHNKLVLEAKEEGIFLKLSRFYFAIPELELAIYCVHFKSGQDGDSATMRDHQANFVANMLETESAEYIMVVGDFNDYDKLPASTNVIKIAPSKEIPMTKPYVVISGEVGFELRDNAKSNPLSKACQTIRESRNRRNDRFWNTLFFVKRRLRKTYHTTMPGVVDNAIDHMFLNDKLARLFSNTQYNVPSGSDLTGHGYIITEFDLRGVGEINHRSIVFDSDKGIFIVNKNFRALQKYVRNKIRYLENKVQSYAMLNDQINKKTVEQYFKSSFDQIQILQDFEKVLTSKEIVEPKERKIWVQKITTLLSDPKLNGNKRKWWRNGKTISFPRLADKKRAVTWCEKIQSMFVGQTQLMHIYVELQGVEWKKRTTNEMEMIISDEVAGFTKQMTELNQELQRLVLSHQMHAASATSSTSATSATAASASGSTSVNSGTPSVSRAKINFIDNNMYSIYSSDYNYKNGLLSAPKQYGYTIEDYEPTIPLSSNQMYDVGYMKNNIKLMLGLAILISLCLYCICIMACSFVYCVSGLILYDRAKKMKLNVNGYDKKEKE
eukprot:194077_1